MPRLQGDLDTNECCQKRRNTNLPPMGHRETSSRDERETPEKKQAGSRVPSRFESKRGLSERTEKEVGSKREKMGQPTKAALVLVSASSPLRLSLSVLAQVERHGNADGRRCPLYATQTLRKGVPLLALSAFDLFEISEFR
ncbi:UNVERIFIED_CONTAM: hypothetical protein HHA_451720 [Hammondia hammondi]|eukprot:XP_008884656.1 hypothetical protein HHA_451720 [Hammondia hammondi]